MSVSYHGHDASLRLTLSADPAAPPLLARIGGAQALALHPGLSVRLAVDGPVVAFPPQKADSQGAP